MITDPLITEVLKWVEEVEEVEVRDRENGRRGDMIREVISSRVMI